MNTERRHAEPKRGAGRRGETFWLLLGRLPKVTRCKSGTIRSRYRSNGYVPNHQEHGRPKGRQAQPSQIAISYDETSQEPLAPEPQPTNINPKEKYSRSPSSCSPKLPTQYK